MKTQGWRGGLVGKSICYSARGTRFGSQDPDGSQLCITLVLVNPIASSGLHMHPAYMYYTYIQTDTIKHNKIGEMTQKLRRALATLAEDLGWAAFISGGPQLPVTPASRRSNARF